MRAAGTIGLCAALVASTARADGPAHARLVTRPGPCELSGLAARVVALAGGRDPFAEDAALELEVATGRYGRDVDGVVTIRGVDGVSYGARDVRADSCDHLVDTIALVIVLSLAHADIASRPPPASSPDATASLPSALEPVGSAGVAARTAIAGAPPLHGELTLATSVGRAGSRWTEAAVLGVRARRAAWSLGVAASVAAPDRLSFGATARVEVTETTIRVDACAHGDGPVACVAAIGGWLTGRGDGLMDARTSTRPVAAVGARIGWEHALGRETALSAGLDVQGAVTATRFLVDGRPVWSTARVEAALGIGLVARFL